MSTNLGHIEKIGRLDRIITIEQGSPTIDSARQETLTWSTYSTPWAAKMDGGGKEAIDAGRETDFSKVVFTIRYDSGVNQKMRVLYNSIYYDIIQLNEIGRERFLEIITESRE